MKIVLKKLISIVFALSALVISVNNASHAQARTKYAQLLINAEGEVLYNRNAHQKMYPASLTKLMTLYLAFESLKAKRISFNNYLVISKRASLMPRSNMGLRANDKIKLEQAVLGLIIRSANDAAVVVAENLSGSEEAFVRRMNLRARDLGMKDTNFANASGWHHPKQITTAYDMAKLAIALKRDFPEYYHLFSKKYFVYNSSLYQGHNYVNAKLYGAEGLKTGFTSNAGWNIVTSAKRGTVSLIGVILGGRSHKARDHAMIKMMNSHFAKYHTPPKTLSASNNTRAKVA